MYLRRKKKKNTNKNTKLVHCEIADPRITSRRGDARFAEFLACLLAAKRTSLVLDREWCGESFRSAGWTDKLRHREENSPRSRKGTRSFRIYLYNTYEACIQSTQTSCWRGLANPFPSSSPKASKERSFESPFVNMGFGRKEDDAAATLRLWLKI